MKDLYKENIYDLTRSQNLQSRGDGTTTTCVNEP